MANSKGKHKGNKVSGALNRTSQSVINRFREEDEKTTLEWKLRNIDTPAYRKMSRLFWILVVFGVISLICSFLAGSVTPKAIPFGLLVAFFVFIIAALALQLFPMHEERMRFAAQGGRRKRGKKKAR